MPVLRGFSRSVKQDSEASTASGGESDRRERTFRGSAFAPAASRLLRTPPIPCAGHMREKYMTHPSSYGVLVSRTRNKTREKQNPTQAPLHAGVLVYRKANKISERGHGISLLPMPSPVIVSFGSMFMDKISEHYNLINFFQKACVCCRTII
jgi:hypothetical protein